MRRSTCSWETTQEFKLPFYESLDSILVHFFFELQNMAFIPYIRRNLIYVPILDRLGYTFLFGTGKVNLYQDSLLFGYGKLCGNLYRLDLYSLLSFSPTINIVSSTKHFKLNEKSYILWHKHWVIFPDRE